VLRYAVRLNGLTELVLNKLDVLSGLDEVKIAVAYEVDGKRLETVPYDLFVLGKALPIYETLPGWTEDIMNAHQLADLPTNARQYVERIEKIAGDGKTNRLCAAAGRFSRAERHRVAFRSQHWQPRHWHYRLLHLSSRVR
jgi:adenylosuccinate synthase